MSRNLETGWKGISGGLAGFFLSLFDVSSFRITLKLDICAISKVSFF